MKLSIIGAGYVGLVTGAGFAQFGHEVVCADINADRVDQLNSGKSPIYEPGLDDMLERNIAEHRLSFTTDLHRSIEDADAVFIAVGTPQSSDGSADLSAVMATARTIGEVLKTTSHHDKLVVVKSTVPVGTTYTVGKIIASYTEIHACVASNPEFLREGTAVEDFLRPDRVVVGTECQCARDVLNKLYRPLAGGRIFMMDPASSELLKYASNAMLATRVSFMNELSNLAVVLGADVDRIREGMGADPRIGAGYLYPGPGYGGSCFPKDIAALINMAELVGQDMKVVRATAEANETQRRLLGHMVQKHFGNMKDRKVCVWGAAFKAETDDIRESPALQVIDDMLAAGATVVVHDPQARSRVDQMYRTANIGKLRVATAEDMYEAVSEADALILCTEWRQYRNPDLARLRELSPKLVAFDGRNIWDRDEFESNGIHLFSISKRPIASSPTFKTRENDLDPVRVLDAPNGVISSRRPTPFQNHTVNESASSVRAFAKG